MPEAFGSRLKHAWNAFQNKDPTALYSYDLGPSYSRRPDKFRATYGNGKSIVAAIYNRMAMDVAATTIQHVQFDEDGLLQKVIRSGLNNCFTTEANLDQTGRAYVQDVAMSMFDEGCVASVPVDTSFDPKISTAYDILSLRTAKIVQWYPRHVKVFLYNDRTGLKEEIILPKSSVGIVENPLASVMNEPNSTLRRLIEKLNLLDMIDAQSGSGKLDLIIQLPYVVKSEARKAQADKRRAEIEEQLVRSKFGVAYTDGTEHITQLNRAVENKLLEQIESLTRMLFSQLGLTPSVFDGTADDKVLANYYSRSIDPVVAVIVDEHHRKFLTKTARTQGQAIYAFRDPFKFMPVSAIAETADKLSRNEIMTGNEFRGKIGLMASKDPNANKLKNKNIAPPAEGQTTAGDQNGGLNTDEKV